MSSTITIKHKSQNPWTTRRKMCSNVSMSSTITMKHLFHEQGKMSSTITIKHKSQKPMNLLVLWAVEKCLVPSQWNRVWETICFMSRERCLSTIIIKQKPADGKMFKRGKPWRLKCRVLLEYASSFLSKGEMTGLSSAGSMMHFCTTQIMLTRNRIKAIETYCWSH